VTWTWSFEDLTDPLHPLALAVVDLLDDADLALLRRCDRCNWLFLDRSRNRSRRWCLMSTCGIAVKVERQAARRRAGRSAS
jgi:predicted RNA-binding Zn ribbon-like protein